jgi:hypothetical protein
MCCRRVVFVDEDTQTLRWEVPLELEVRDKKALFPKLKHVQK